MDQIVDTLSHKDTINCDTLDMSNQLWRINNLYYIQNKEGKRVLFKLNDQQFNLYKEMWYRNNILKSRQHGFTTFIDIFELDTALFNANTACGIIAHSKEDVIKIFRTKIRYPYRNLPEIIQDSVPITTQRATEYIFGNDSSVSVSLSFRSGTLQILHVSEFGKIAAKYPDKAREIVTGAFEAVAEGQMIFVESTAEGQEGVFYDMCKSSQDLSRSGRELHPLEFKFFFVAWYREKTYTTDSKLVTITKKESEYFARLKDEHGIELTSGQKAWYVLKARTLGDDMKREHPSTPEEAFEASIEGAYYSLQMAKARNEERIGVVPYEPRLPVNTLWDLGMDDSMTIWFHQQDGMQHRLFDYEEHSGEGLEFYARLLQEKKYVYGNHYMPHDIAVRELGTGVSRYHKAQELGITPIVRVPRAVNQEQVRGGIESVRSFLNTCWIDEAQCSRGISCLDNYRKEWDRGLSKFRSSPLHNWASHGADSLRTGAVGLIGLKSTKKIPNASKQKHQSSAQGWT